MTLLPTSPQNEKDLVNVAEGTGTAAGKAVVTPQKPEETLNCSTTEEQMPMEDFGKSETECLREVVKEFRQQYSSTFHQIKDDFQVMMVCTSTNHAQKVWYIALLCSNIKLLQCKAVNSQLPVPLNLIANKTSEGYEIDYGYEEQHDYKEDYNKLEELTNKARGVVMKLPPWNKVLPRVKFFKYLALVHMKHNIADRANLFDLEFKEKKITLKLKGKHNSLMMTEYANSLYHVLYNFLGASSETKLLCSRLYKLGYHKYDIDSNWLDCSSEALKRMKKGYSKNKKDDSNKNKEGQKLGKDDEKDVGTGSAGEIKVRNSITRHCNKNKKTIYTENEEEDVESEEEEEKKTEQNSTEAASNLKRKFDQVVVEKEKVGSKKNKNDHTVESDKEKNNTMSSGQSENQVPVAKKITSFTTATFTAATVAKFQTFDKKFENDDKYPFPIEGEQSDVSRNLDCMTKEGKYITKLRNDLSLSKSFVDLAFGQLDNSSKFWNFMHFVQKYVFDLGRFKKSQESWLKSKRMTVAAAVQSNMAGIRKELTDDGDSSNDSIESVTPLAETTPLKQAPSATLASVLVSVLASASASSASADSLVGDKESAMQSKTKLKKSNPVMVYITQGKTDHIATIVDPAILAVVAKKSSANRSLASLFPDKDAEMDIKWQSTDRIGPVFIEDARWFELDEPATARSIEAEATKRANVLRRKYDNKEKEDIRNAIWGEGTPTSIVDRSGIEESVQPSSMKTLKPGVWLNDEIVNFFYLVIAKRTTKKKLQSHCHCFKSFFMKTLLSEEGGYEYNKVKGWSKKVPDGDIFALDKILLPINVSNSHWISAVIFMQKKQIQIVDSLDGTNDQRYLQFLMNYLEDEHLDKKQEALPDMDKWKLVSTPKNAPRQKNGYDCGVFSCIAAYFLSDDLPLKFDQRHIDQSREYIALSILRGGIRGAPKAAAKEATDKVARQQQKKAKEVQTREHTTEKRRLLAEMRAKDATQQLNDNDSKIT